MDLNQLLFQHQRAMMNQHSSTARFERETYFDLVEYYAKRIRQFRREAGVDDHRWTTRYGH